MKKRLLLGFLTLLMALGVLFGVAACMKAVNDLSLDRSDQPQTTGVQTKNGRVEVSLEPYATKMLAVEG